MTIEEKNKNEYLPIAGSFITGKVAFGNNKKYIADEDGIMEITEITYNDGSVDSIGRMVLSKEVFVAAYNAYISDEIKKLEKSNRNWRRKCQRLRNKQEV